MSNYLNLACFVRDKDKPFFKYYQDYLDYEVRLDFYKSKGDYLNEVKSYYSFLLYGTVNSFILDEVIIKSIVKKNGSCYVEFNDKKQAKKLLEEAVARLENNHKEGGFGWLAKVSMWNQARFLMDVIAVLGMLSKKQELKNFWAWNSKTFLDVIFIKENTDNKVKPSQITEWKNKINNYFKNQIDNQVKGFKQFKEKMEKDIKKLHPNNHPEPWLAKKIDKFKTNLHGNQNSNYWKQKEVMEASGE